ncbi:MAG: hypothetical protein L0Z62_15190 [Gemmataceae bacterium]|nr:hypothetical protein [Gemmataceae bacterium]
MTDYDSPWKEALDLYFEQCLAFFFPQAHADIDWGRGYETLDKEFQQVVRAAEQGRRYVDKLVKVWLKSGEEQWLLIHVEVQTSREGEFPKRMYVYNYRIFDRYDREVVSLAILGDDDPNWRPDHFGHQRWGCSAGLRFPVVKLLDYAAHEQALEAHPNPFAMVVLAHLKTLETRQNPADRQAWKVRLVKGLYERGLNAKDVRQLIRFIDWVMDLPPVLERLVREEIHRYEEEKRMPFMTSFERFARTEELLAGIELGLELKLGAQGLQLMPEIRQITDIEKLRAIRQAIRTATTPDDLRKVWAPGAAPPEGES